MEDSPEKSAALEPRSSPAAAQTQGSEDPRRRRELGWWRGRQLHAQELLKGTLQLGAPRFSDPKNVLEGNNGRKCALGVNTCPAPSQPHRQ